MNRTKGFIALVSTSAIFGFFGLLIRELSKTFSNSGQVFARSMMATVIIAGIILVKKINPFKIETINKKYILGFSIVFPLSLLCFTFSANSIKVTNSLFMLYVGSLASTALIGKFLFNEAFTRKHLIALVLVLTGLTFFVYPFSIDAISLGLLAGIAAGILEGASHAFRRLMKDVQRKIIVFYQSISGALFGLVLVVFSNEVFVKQFHFSAIPVTILFGILLVVIGYLLAYGFSHFDVNWGTIILATELFFAMVVSALFLQEYPTTFELIGGILIFSATIVTSIFPERKHT